MMSILLHVSTRAGHATVSVVLTVGEGGVVHYRVMELKWINLIHGVFSQIVAHTFTQRSESFQPYRLPKNSMVFWPPRIKTEVLKPLNFMQKAKVCVCGM